MQTRFRHLILLIAVIQLLSLTSCSQSRDIPYDEMLPVEAAGVSTIQSSLTGLDGHPFRSAVRINGVCYYGYLLYAEEQILPGNSQYQGLLSSERCNKYTTPKNNLEADMSFWLLGEVDIEVYLCENTPYFKIIDENADTGAILYFHELTTEAPVYYDDGNWMLQGKES